MFGDGDWIPDRTYDQEELFQQWLHNITGSKVVVVDIGAGRGKTLLNHTISPHH